MNRKAFADANLSSLGENLLIKIGGPDELMSQGNSIQNNSNGSYRDQTNTSQFDIASFDENINNLNAIDEASGNLLELSEFDLKPPGQQNRASSLLTASSASSLMKSSTMNKLSGEANVDGMQGEDLFGIDMETINNHKRNLTSNNSAYNLLSHGSSSNEDEHEESEPVVHSNMSLNSRRSIVSSKRRASELYNLTKNQSYSTNDEFSTNDEGPSRTKNGLIDEELVESYEKSVSCLF